MNKLLKHPILILLTFNLVIGLLTFRSYGLSWDEPLFYEYGTATLYAYNPTHWLNPDFNLEESFGASASDHANRGPAYLILAAPLINLLKMLGSDPASAWHLTNFLTFNLGVYFIYRLASKWISQQAALAVAFLFTFQPLFWGHAFINPKDIPFLTFFLGAVLFGVELIDKWKADLQTKKIPIFHLLFAAAFLGLSTSIRVLGPLAAILVILYALSQGFKITELIKHPVLWLYAAFALLIMFLTWPYLWVNPLQKFIEVFIYMSDNPTQLNVLFAGENYPAGALPRRYFPILLSYTLTEPALLLMLSGLLLGFWKADLKQKLTLSVLLAWFGLLFIYILLRRPAMYDGYRHFFFILPPLFIFTGFAFERIFQWLKHDWQKIVLTLALGTFGMAPIIQLHPYQYAYYNSLAGGLSNVFRSYETEYWLTCYREAVIGLNQTAEAGTRLFVRREAYIAATYANANITIHDFRSEQKNIQSGDYYLVNSRSNEDLKFLRDEPTVIEVSRMGAVFCVIKQVP